MVGRVLEARALEVLIDRVLVVVVVEAVPHRAERHVRPRHLQASWSVRSATSGRPLSRIRTSRSLVAMAGVSDDATSIMEPEVRSRSDRAAIVVVTPILRGSSFGMRPCLPAGLLVACLRASSLPRPLTHTCAVLLSPKCSLQHVQTPDSHSDKRGPPSLPSSPGRPA